LTGKSDLCHIKLTSWPDITEHDGILCEKRGLISVAKKRGINKTNAKKWVKLDYFK
jgi:hypothetical protein